MNITELSLNHNKAEEQDQVIKWFRAAFACDNQSGQSAGKMKGDVNMKQLMKHSVQSRDLNPTSSLLVA